MICKRDEVFCRSRCRRYDSRRYRPVCELFGADGNHWVDLSGAAGWEQAGKESNQGERERGAEEQERLGAGGGSSGCPMGHDPAKRCAEHGSGDEASAHAAEHGRGNDAQDMVSRCAQGHADAELVGTLDHGVRDHAVEPDSGHQQRKQGKDAEEPGEQAAACPLRFVLNPVLPRRLRKSSLKPTGEIDTCRWESAWASAGRTRG